MNFNKKLVHPLRYMRRVVNLSNKNQSSLYGISQFNDNKNNFNIREFHTTQHNDSLITLGIVLVTTGYFLQYGNQALQTISKSSENSDTKTEGGDKQTNDASKEGSAENVKAENKNQDVKKDKAKNESGAQSGGGFASFTNNWFTKGFYDGGFEEKMTRKEAALILGVRESASSERIKEQHRKVLILNHPDRGGSAYLAAKINEAKDLLLKGK